MSSFFNYNGDSARNLAKEKEDLGTKRSSMPMAMPKSIKKAVSRSFDRTGSSGSGAAVSAKAETTPKRSSLPKLFSAASSHGHQPQEGSSMDWAGQNHTEAPLLPSTMMSHDEAELMRRSSMGHIANKAVSASGSVMRSAVFAPVVAGKAMMHGSVKAVHSSVKAGQLVVDHSIKTTSNIAKAAENTVLSANKAVVGGGKAVLGSGKAIVGGTTSAVEYGGKRLVKGTKGMVKGIKSATNLKSFSSRCLDEKKSKWEKGIEIIEALLEPGTDTFEAMTPEQRKELYNVKRLLITGPNKNDKIAHIPRDLIKMKKSENSNFGVGEKRLSSNFILQEFAGVKDTSLLGDGSELDTSESSNDASHGDLSTGDLSRGDISTRSHTRNRSPIPPLNRNRPKIKKENSHSSLGSLASLQQGFGNLTHDDPALDVFNFVPIEFKKLSKDSQMELYNMLSWNSINKWDFDIFRLNKLTKRRPLLFIGWSILGSPYAQSAMAKQIGLDYEPPQEDGYSFMDDLMIPPQKLCNYLRVIELDYRAENAYHNAIHAADVMQSLHTLIQMSLDEPFLAGCPNIKLFTILLAAAIHDVDHPGKTNAFHTNSRTELALMYNDSSVLENWHVAHAFARMLGMELKGNNSIHDSKDIAVKNEQAQSSANNFLCNAHPEQFKVIRNLMIEAVLHTDMTKHFEMVNAAKGLLRQQYKDENTWKVLMFMLHMADISGQAKADPLFKQWTRRCMDEFFAQGDEEAALGLTISPNCDRHTTVTAESQVGFIKFVVEPAYEVLAMFVPFVQDNVLAIIHNNLGFWVDRMESPDEDLTQIDESVDMMDASERRGSLAASVDPLLDEAENDTATLKVESMVTVGTKGQVQIEV